MRVLMFTLSFVAGYFAQAHQETLSLREAVDVVADYSVVHTTVPQSLDWYGLTDPDSRTIFLIDKMDLAQRRRVAIHEMTHVALRMRGDEAYKDEDVVQILTEIEYKKLYGGAQ